MSDSSIDEKQIALLITLAKTYFEFKYDADKLENTARKQKLKQLPFMAIIARQGQEDKEYQINKILARLNDQALNELSFAIQEIKANTQTHIDTIHKGRTQNNAGATLVACDFLLNKCTQISPSNQPINE